MMRMSRGEDSCSIDSQPDAPISVNARNETGYNGMSIAAENE
jgi:hypothetical protein